MTERISFNEKITERIIKRTIQDFAVDKLDFEIMALDDHLIAVVKSCDSYKQMLFTAASNGLVYKGSRMVDYESVHAEDIEATWGDESVDIDCDPCVRARVGEKVCEISGLGEYIEEVNVLEIEMAEEAEAAAKKAAEEAEAKAEKERVFQLGEHEVTGSTQLENLPATDDVYLDAESLEEEAAANADY